MSSVGDIEGKVKTVRFSHEMPGQGGSTYYIVNYFVLGEWYSKAIPDKKVASREGDLVFIHYKEVFHKGEIQRRIESIEVIEEANTEERSNNFNPSFSNTLKAIEIASQMVIHCEKPEGATIEDLHSQILEEAEKILQYVEGRRV